MKTEHEWRSIRDLVELYRNKMLVANAEYQRGNVWSLNQKKKLVDSVFRGYPLPLIYLHHIKKSVAGMQREDFEIIDGQQRITALYEFVEGNYAPFDPIKDDNKARFPAFLKNQPCPWGGKLFPSLPANLQDAFLDTELGVERIETVELNEVRDLFVRLQSGLPLNSQETRDSWPGDFTDFILSLGGKPELARYPGHHFFQGPMGLKPRSDRGKTRQFAAQIAMLYFSRREHGRNHFMDINANSVNDFYLSNVDFDKTSTDAKRLNEILTTIDRLLGSSKRPKLKGHDAIHLVLLVDTLWDGYTRSWEDKLPLALDKFMEGFALAKAQKDSPHPDEFWVKYAQWTRVNSDRGERISRRHLFYTEKMFEYLSPLQLKDSTRLFGDLEREILFFKNYKTCAVCDAEVSWDDAEIHHVVEHSKGGKTNLDNAALVHSACHPKGEAAVKEFAKEFLESKSTPPKTNTKFVEDESQGLIWKSGNYELFLPQGTEIRMTYKKNDNFAHVEGDQIIFNGNPHTPTSLANTIADNTSRNAWRDLWIKFPDNDSWEFAFDLRSEALGVE